MSNRPKPRRNYKKGTTEVTKRQEIDITSLVTKTWMLQEEIDNYNKSLVYGDVDEFFNDINLSDNSVIIRPFKENFIKGFSEETMTINNAGFRQIDNRKRSTDQESYVETPFKYITSGVIVAASKEFLEQRNISIGDIVYVRQPQWMNCRFYVNRQDGIRDYVSSQDNWSLVFFEGYFNVSQFDIELSISNETFKEKYMDKVLSPIYGKCTLEELIENEKLQKERVEKMRQEQLLKTSQVGDTHIGKEVNIKDINRDNANFTG